MKTGWCQICKRLTERRFRIMSLLGCCILIVALINVLQSPVVVTSRRAPAHDRKKHEQNKDQLLHSNLPTTGEVRDIADQNITLVNTTNVGISSKTRKRVSDINKHISIGSGVPEQRRSTKTKRNNSSYNDLIVNFLLSDDTYRFNIDNFISVWSVVKHFKPVRVIFHSHVMPVDSPWWRRSLTITPHSEVILLNRSLGGSGIEDSSVRSFHILRRYGGLVVPPNIVFLKPRPQATDLIVDGSTHPGNIIYVRNNTSKFLDMLDLKIRSSTSTDFSKKLKMRFENISFLTLGESDVYCITNASLPNEKSVFLNETLVKIDLSYSAYQRPLTVDQIASSDTLWAAIARQTLFGSRDPVYTTVPNSYHYLWTESKGRDLNIMEVISIKSVFHYAKPDKIYFHSRISPVGKMWDDVSRIPGFILRPVNTSGRFDCFKIKMDILRREGGLILDFNVVVTDDSSIFRLGYLQLQYKPANNDMTVNYTNNITLHSFDESPHKQTECPRVFMSCKENQLWRYSYAVIWPVVISKEDHFYSTDSLLQHTFLLVTNTSDLTETTLSTQEGPVGNLARYVLYGDTNVFGKETSLLVPNIVHYIWFGNDTKFCFHAFLCIYSAEINQKPDKIYFHYENLPTGKWWQTLTSAVTLTLVHTVPPTSVFSRPIRVVEHQSDVARLAILKKYGGMYLDIDMFVINSLDPLRTHSFVMAEEQHGTLGNGIILAKKDSTFLKFYLDSYRYFDDTLWGYNSVVVPYKLMLHNRNLIHLGPRDRILKPDWSTCLDDIWYPKSRYYWHDNYVLHLYCKSNVKEYLPVMNKLVFSERFATSTFGQIARNVYEHFKHSVEGSGKNISLK